MMNRFWDLIVIGSGPAGLSAAATAAECGLDVLVLDEQPALGGQLYRNIEQAGEENTKILGPDYRRGLALVERFRKSGGDYRGGAVVWSIEKNGHVCFSSAGASTEISGRHVIIATGAMERPVPFPGWTLPGVMGAGAADALFKNSGLIPEGPVVLAGSGPLLLSVAGHMARLGVEIIAILDTTPLKNVVEALPGLPKALRRVDYLMKGLGMLAVLKKSGIKHYRGVTGYEATGNGRVRGVAFRAGNKTRHIKTGLLLVHEGIVPRTDFSRQVGLPHRWDPVQRYWYPELNAFGGTTCDKIHIAGDGAFVHGGIAAEAKGAIAALDIAANIRAVSKARQESTLRALKKSLASELAPRPFVDALYRPRPNLYRMEDRTVVCRCEEITAEQIRQALIQGCEDPNEIKALTRCGMGQCQSRMCGAALSEIVAEHRAMAPSDFNALNIRPPVRNVTLSEMAQLSLLEARTK